MRSRTVRTVRRCSETLRLPGCDYGYGTDHECCAMPWPCVISSLQNRTSFFILLMLHQSKAVEMGKKKKKKNREEERSRNHGNNAHIIATALHQAGTPHSERKKESWRNNVCHTIFGSRRKDREEMSFGSF